MRPSTLAAVRSAAARRDPRALARAARAAGPEALARAWPGLAAVARVVAFRALDARAAPKLFAVLPHEGRWLAYLGSLSDGAAPLFDGAPPSARRVLRRPAARELAAMRRALARGRA